MFSLSMLTIAFYLFGIYFTDDVGFSAAFFLFLTLFITAVIKSNYRRMLFIVAFAVFLGIFRYGSVCVSPVMRQFNDKYITASGVIFSETENTDGEYSYKHTFRMDTFSYLGVTYKTNQKFILHTQTPFEFGDYVQVSGFLRDISGIKNEFEYDFSAYYKSRGIYGRIIARKAEKLGEEFIFSPEFIAGKIKSRISPIISRNFTGNRAALLKAILLNNKSDFDKDYKEALLRSGAYRSLYSPFMHISLLFLLAGLFCHSRKTREQLVIVLILAYALFFGTAPTVLKACAITILLIFKKELSGFSNKLDVLSLVVLMLTFFDPMLCFDSGFIISVASTVLVYFSYMPIYNRICAFFTKKHLPIKLCSILTLWIILTLGTMPFCAYFGNGISVYSVLYTSLMLPIIGIIIGLSLPTLLVLSLFGSNLQATVLLDFVLQVVEKFLLLAQHFPFSFLELKTPPVREIIMFYLFWWAFLRALSGMLRTKKTKILLLSVTILYVLGILPDFANTLSINFVNVEQGDGAVLHTSHGETVIIDGGGAPEYIDSYNIGEQIFVPYLISHGLTDIDVAILSHPHKDHAEGIVAAAKRLKINTLVMPDVEPDNPYRKELEELSKIRGFSIEYLASGDEIRFKSGLNIKFLAPDATQLRSPDANAASLVAHISFGEFDALFTGDSADTPDENYPYDTDILKVAHHGSDSSTDSEYARRIRPKYAVIGVGEDNSYGLPDESVLDNLNEVGAKILRTDQCGDIRFKVKKNGKITYKTLKGG